MKEITFPLDKDEHLIILSDNELNLIRALSNYMSSVKIEETGMTSKAYNLNSKLYEKLNNMELFNSFDIWK